MLIQSSSIKSIPIKITFHLINVEFVQLSQGLLFAGDFKVFQVVHTSNHYRLLQHALCYLQLKTI